MPEPVRLWIISELYYPEMTSTGYYITTIAEGLTAEHDVRVICGQPNYAQRGSTAPRGEVRNSVAVSRVSGTRMDKNNIAGRIVNMLTFGTGAFWRCLRSFRRGDRAVVVTTPPLLPFFVAIAALMKGASYTLLVHDAYPEQLVAVGALSADSMPVRVLQFFNRWLYKHASKIIVVGRDMKELLERKTDGLDVPVVVIPNWAEIDDVRPLDRADNALLARLGIADKFVVLSAGNLGRPTDVETIVSCAVLMQDEPEVHFLFVGDGAKASWLRSQVASRGLDNVTVTGAMPREEQSLFLSACDIGIITFVPGMLGAAVPSRLYNLLAAGRPVIAVMDHRSEVCRVLEEENVGRGISSADPIMLKEAILDMKSDISGLRAMGERARVAAERKYSPSAAIASYMEVLR